MTASDRNVVLQQWLYYKQRGTFTMAYHHFWGILMRESRYGRTRLELYESSRPNSRLALTLPLTDVFHVMNRSARARSHAFQILGMDTKYHFAARTERECRTWMDAITRVTTGIPEAGVEYEFCVTVMCNQHSTALNLTGNYLLVVSNTHVTLMSSNGMLCSRFNCHLLDLEKVVFANMDCSKQRLSILTLHTMSTSAVNKGTFVFQTGSARDIVKVINERISLLGGQPGGAEAKKREQMSRSMIQKPQVEKTGSLDWKHLQLQISNRKVHTMVQRSVSIDAISPVLAESRLPGLSSSNSFLFEGSTSSSSEASPSHSTNNVSRSVDDLLLTDSVVARRDFTLQVSKCSQNLTPIHQKVPCEDVPVNNEAWLEPAVNLGFSESDSCPQLTSFPPLAGSSRSSRSSLAPSDSSCQRRSSETANDVFGDAENLTDTWGRNPLLDYVNSSSIIQHYRDLQIQKLASQSHSNVSFPSATSSISLQLSPTGSHHQHPIPLHRKMRSMQELSVVPPVPKSRSIQHCSKPPSQSWSSGQLTATGRGGTLETSTSVQYWDDTRDDFLAQKPNLTLSSDTPEIASSERRASTEDLIDKIEQWIPEWRKEEYLSAQRKCQEKRRTHSGHDVKSPERLQVKCDFDYVQDHSSDSENDNSPQSPIYLDILSDLTASESPKSASSPYFTSAPLPNTTHSEELTSSQSYSTNHTCIPAASSSSPSFTGKCIYPTESLPSPLTSKQFPKVESALQFTAPTLPLSHPSGSLPSMTFNEFPSSLDLSLSRAQAHDPTSGSLEWTYSQQSMLNGSGSQHSSPCHKLSHDVSTSSIKAGSESPGSQRSSCTAASGLEIFTGGHTHANFDQSPICHTPSSFDELGEEDESRFSTHIDEPLYSSISSTTYKQECSQDLSIQSDDYYACPDELLPTFTPGTVGLLPLGEVIDPYCRVSEEQLRDLASRPPAMPPAPPSPPPRTSPEKSPDRRKPKDASTEDYMYDYPYMSEEARKRMILRMLQKLEEKEEKGVYIEMCKPQVPPRPHNTLPSIREHGSPQHHTSSRHQLYDHNSRSAFDRLPSLPSTPTSPPIHMQTRTPSYN